MIQKLPQHKYLARLASSRALYRLLFRQAESVLPPPSAGLKGFEEVSCRLSQQELAKRLGCSRSVVGEDLRRLLLHRWITRKGRTHYDLGTRVGENYYLHADVAAMEATGQKHLISNLLLGLHLGRTKQWADKGDDASERGGVQRKWRGSKGGFEV